MLLQINIRFFVIDFDDEIQVMQMDDPDAHEEIYPLSRYSPETQLKIKIALFIRHGNMNKTNSNALLNLIRGISAM